MDVVTGEPVQSHNKARGYEVGENQFLLVRDDELKAAEQEARNRPYSSTATASATGQDGVWPSGLIQKFGYSTCYRTATEFWPFA